MWMIKHYVPGKKFLKCTDSRVINIESHTLFHRETFKNLNIRDFYNNKEFIVPYKFLASPYLEISDAGKEIKNVDYLGLPLFEAAPLMLAGNKINISKDFKSLCKEIFENSRYNKINNWKSEIKRITSSNLKNENYFSIQTSSRKDVFEDLCKAKEIIQQKLDKNAGNHLCLPWTIGNEATLDVCKQLGIWSCFWGVMNSKKINKSGDDPYYICRIKNDFIFRLPGISRKSFFSLYYDKIKRRLKGEKIF